MVLGTGDRSHGVLSQDERGAGTGTCRGRCQRPVVLEPRGYGTDSCSVAQSCPTLVTPWTAARQASLSITNSQTLLKLMSIESVRPSNHLILSCPLLPPSIFPSIRVFSSESALPIRWPKCWSFSFSISPSNEYSELISFRLTTLISLQELTGLASNPWFGPVISFL